MICCRALNNKRSLHRSLLGFMVNGHACCGKQRVVDFSVVAGFDMEPQLLSALLISCSPFFCEKRARMLWQAACGLVLGVGRMAGF